VAHAGWLLGLAWVFGVALQLQQPGLWPLDGYMALLVGALGVMGWVGRTAFQPDQASSRWGQWSLLCAVLLAGAGTGFGLTGARAAHFAAQALSPALEGLDLTVTGRIASLPRRTELGERFDLRVETAEWQGQTVALPPRLQLSWYGAAAWGAPPGVQPPGRLGPGLQAGDRWRFTVRLKRPHGNANPHGFDRERWLWEQGIGATGYVRNGPRDPAPQHLGATGWHPLEQARQSVARRISAQIDDGRTAGVLSALVVGEQSAIERQDWDLFRTTGVAHLMSISGLHVTMFAWLATVLVGAGWRRLAGPMPQALLAVPVPLAAGVGGVLLALAYALFSGWGVPSQRTVIMLAVVVGLRLTVRQWPWPLVWLLAMVAVLLLDPWALLQPGFWLSFVAVGILFASDPGRRVSAHAGGATGLPQRGVRSAVGLLREQAVVTIALAPLTLLLFGQFSLVGLVANLFAIPVVTLVVTPLAMLGVLLPPLWDAAALAVQGMVSGLQWLGQWPWAAVYRAVPPLLLALAAVLGGILLVLRLPWAVRAAGLLLAWPVLLWSPARPPPGEFDLMAIDVGQGSAVLLRTASHSLLYDTGPRYGPDSDAGQRVVVPLLRALGERPDTVVVSHRDSDHAGGMEAVRVVWPQARWLSSFDSDPARRCVAGQRWEWDGVSFEVLHPSPGHYGPQGQGLLSSNAMSCVLRVASARHSAWLGGDIDAAQETRLALARPQERATVLLAPHHGSATSSSPVLLNTLQPRWVLVQSGYRNRFGHPSPVVVERYHQRGIAWVDSPDCGAAIWRSTAPEAVRCQRAVQRRYWHATAPQAVEPVSQGPADRSDDMDTIRPR
jgi:competence protein ComEC